MPTHTTPPPHADQTDQEAEPARRASRFDERGIALQTIIIMVVLLAIAGAVAAVLFNRASTETARLENSEDVFAYAIGDRLQCNSLGHRWKETDPSGELASIRDARNQQTLVWKASPDSTKTPPEFKGWCDPTP